MVKYYNNLRHEQAKSEVLLVWLKINKKNKKISLISQLVKEEQSSISLTVLHIIQLAATTSFYAAKIPPKNPGDLLMSSLNQRGRGLTNYTPNNTVAFLKIFLVENGFIYRSQLSGDTLRLMESMKQASESESRDAALLGLSATLVGS